MGKYALLVGINYRKNVSVRNIALSLFPPISNDVRFVGHEPCIRVFQPQSMTKHVAMLQCSLFSHKLDQVIFRTTDCLTRLPPLLLCFSTRNSYISFSRSFLCLCTICYVQPEAALEGCVNDTYLTKAILRAKGFDDKNIRVSSWV